MAQTDDSKHPVKLSLPLVSAARNCEFTYIPYPDTISQDFQQDLFKELREEDELVILARGLGLLRVVTNLLHSYDAAGNNLIIIIGADERENGWIGESLPEHAATSMSPKARGLTTVTTDLMSVGTREELYGRGGIFSITSRILVVDFLSTLLDPALVSGVIVLHAERVVATSLEAFILRIYRQKNKAGFLKAFSDTPEAFTSGFSPLTSMMRNLFLRRPALWPRYHATVTQDLEGKKKAEVIELEIPMTDAMKDIQNAVLECVEVSIGELKRSNTGLDMEDWTLDSALHRNFDQIVRRQLDPVWHRTSFRTKQIVRDLTLLRSILHSVLTNDAVSFNKYLDTVLAASSPPPGSTRQTQSPWLFLEAAHTIFDSAKRRVYRGSINESESTTDTLRPVLEEQPKWAILAEILQEIDRDIYFNPKITDDSNGTILIMCGDQGSCRQIREYLQGMYVQTEESNIKDFELEPSAVPMMRRRLRNYLQWKKDFSKVSAALFTENQKSINGSSTTDQKGLGGGKGGRGPPNKRRRVRGGGAAGGAPSRNTGGGVYVAGDRDAHIASLLAELQPTEAEASQKGEIAYDSLENMEDYYELYEMRDLTLVHPYDGDDDDNLLEEVRPRYIIMYEPDLAFIRRVEVYRSSHTDRNVRVYFMYYAGSVEEQRYLSSSRREKEAFMRLIKERGGMALTHTLDAHGIADPQEAFLRTVNTRIAGGGRVAATAQPPRVVVDVREFRSSLPCLCHGRNMETIPCTLTVGDYVLTPQICVERKSVRDLISSFNNGRLYTQAERMLEYYKSPFLLIEFDAGKSFTLEPFADLSMSGGGSSLASLHPGQASDLQSKLVLLTLAFPRLKVIWSSSPYQTAEIFEELKKQQEEPDPLRAVQLGLEDGEEAEGRTWSQVPQDMLRGVPGVNAKVMQALLLVVDNLQELSNMTEEELDPIIGKEAGRQIVRFFNRDVTD